jgi:hypothetical protein
LAHPKSDTDLAQAHPQRRSVAHLASHNRSHSRRLRDPSNGPNPAHPRHQHQPKGRRLSKASSNPRALAILQAKSVNPIQRQQVFLHLPQRTTLLLRILLWMSLTMRHPVLMARRHKTPRRRWSRKRPSRRRPRKYRSKTNSFSTRSSPKRDGTSCLQRKARQGARAIMNHVHNLRQRKPVSIVGEHFGSVLGKLTPPSMPISIAVYSNHSLFNQAPWTYGHQRARHPMAMSNIHLGK